MPPSLPALESRNLFLRLLMFAERHLTALQDNLSSLGQRFTRYVGDISKGIAILIIAGLAASMVLCLVRCCSNASA